MAFSYQGTGAWGRARRPPRALVPPLLQKVGDMPGRHVRQLAEDGVALLLVEGQRLETGGFQMEIGDALAPGIP